MKHTALLFIIAAFPLMTIAQTRRNGNGYNNNRNNNNYHTNQNTSNDYGYEAGSALTVYSESGEQFLLILNGIKQNNYPETRVRVEGLPDVTNDIQIIFNDNRTPSITKRVAFMDPVEGKPVNLTVNLVRDRGGNPRMNFVRMTSLERDYRGQQGEYILSYGHDRQQRNVEQVPPPPPPPPPTPNPMDNQSFMAAKQAIKGSSWDETKLSTAQTILNTNFFTTDQVMDICRLFSWEDSKLTFAKAAFKKTVDNTNYFKVNAIFDWDSNKKALNDYVNANR
ncbi:MAG: DUF4476 domain-containing protein [Taibaiella sp.]|nr:DUF4476 domain-containing protein [Taibaiella sp.]